MNVEIVCSVYDLRACIAKVSLEMNAKMQGHEYDCDRTISSSGTLILLSAVNSVCKSTNAARSRACGQVAREASQAHPEMS